MRCTRTREQGAAHRHGGSGARCRPGGRHDHERRRAVDAGQGPQDRSVRRAPHRNLLPHGGRTDRLRLSGGGRSRGSAPAPRPSRHDPLAARAVRVRRDGRRVPLHDTPAYRAQGDVERGVGRLRSGRDAGVRLSARVVRLHHTPAVHSELQQADRRGCDADRQHHGADPRR